MTAERIDYLQGRYDQCARLLTSPRMNRSQREVITDEALEVRAELERLGVAFIGAIEDTTRPSVEDRRRKRWPTDESIRALNNDVGAMCADDWPEDRYRLRAALLADPIVKAAVALVAHWGTDMVHSVGRTPQDAALVRAVHEAGLRPGA